MMRESYDIAVVGAGAAGIAAGIGAAREGASVLLVDPAPGPAGIACGAGLTTLCGLYVVEPISEDAKARGRSESVANASPRFSFANDGVPREIAEALMREDGVAGPILMGGCAVLPYRPESFRRVAARMIAAEKRIEAAWGWKLAGAEIVEGRVARLQISNLKFETSNPAVTQPPSAAIPSMPNPSSSNQNPNVAQPSSAAMEAITIHISAAIDCTGSGALAAMAGEAFLDYSASMLTPAIVFPLRKAAPLLARAGAVQALLLLSRAVASGELPPGSDAMAFEPGAAPDEATAKLNLGDVRARVMGEGLDSVARAANAQARAIADFLRRAAPNLQDCSMPEGPYPVSFREGRCVDARRVLAGADLLAARRFEDAACRGCWPIEQWDARGRPRLRHLPAGACYDIPLDSLRGAKTKNLFFAGKVLGADAEALASARVIGTCLATGEAAGRAAARLFAKGAAR